MWEGGEGRGSNRDRDRGRSQKGQTRLEEEVRGGQALESRRGEVESEMRGGSRLGQGR